MEGHAKPRTIWYHLDTVLILVAYVGGIYLMGAAGINWLAGDGDFGSFIHGLALLFAGIIIRKERRISELEGEND